ncbi:MAG: hypothetical protein KA124_04520 [Luteimonas sp.]|nr:hypothetical protein [Luteimonas sp.]
MLEAFGALAFLADARFLLVAAEAAQGVGATVPAAAVVGRVAPVGGWNIAARLAVARGLALALVALGPFALRLFPLAAIATDVAGLAAVRIAVPPLFRHALARGLFALFACADLLVGDAGLSVGIGVALALLLALAEIALRLFALAIQVAMVVGPGARVAAAHRVAVPALALGSLQALRARAVLARTSGFRLRALRLFDARALAFAGIAARFLQARTLVVVASAFALVLGEHGQGGGERHACGHCCAQHGASRHGALRPAANGRDLLHVSPLDAGPRGWRKLM